MFATFILIDGLFNQMILPTIKFVRILYGNIVLSYIVFSYILAKRCIDRESNPGIEHSPAWQASILPLNHPLTINVT